MFIPDDELFEIRRLVAEYAEANGRALRLDDAGAPDADLAFAQADEIDSKLKWIADNVFAQRAVSVLDLAKRAALLERHYPRAERELVDSDNAAEHCLGQLIEAVHDLVDASTPTAGHAPTNIPRIAQ